jgi:hypothetical protein
MTLLVYSAKISKRPRLSCDVTSASRTGLRSRNNFKVQEPRRSFPATKRPPSVSRVPSSSPPQSSTTGCIPRELIQKEPTGIKVKRLKIQSLPSLGCRKCDGSNELLNRYAAMPLPRNRRAIGLRQACFLLIFRFAARWIPVRLTAVRVSFQYQILLRSTSSTFLSIRLSLPVHQSTILGRVDIVVLALVACGAGDASIWARAGVLRS